MIVQSANPRLQTREDRTLPIIDLSPFTDNREAQKRKVAADVRWALGTIGFFYAIGHGLPAELQTRVMDQSRKFFARSAQDKDKVSIARSKNHRGFFAIGAEHVAPGKTRDIKEGFDIGMEAPVPENQARTLRGQNQWPYGMPAFRADVEAFYDATLAAGRNLCRACALALDLPESFFDATVERPESRLRLLHYPPATSREGQSLGAGEHTDCGYLTMLAQDDVGGLEVQSPDGAWIQAHPVPQSMVINVGRLMSDLTDGRFVATPHRVKSHPERDRYSIAVFFNPDFDLQVPAFASLLGIPKSCSTQSAGDYIRQCYDEIRPGTEDAGNGCGCGTSK